MEAVIHLPCQEDIHALFQMTPYYWKTPRAGAERLAALTALDVTISFDIHVSGGKRDESGLQKRFRCVMIGL